MGLHDATRCRCCPTTSRRLIMLFTSQDHAHMARALQLAQRGRFTTDPNPNVGCIIVGPDGSTVAEGWHERAGEGHAEASALSVAGTKAKGATVYVTLEPCSHHGRTAPCADALIAADVARVVCAMEDPNPQVAGEGIKKLSAAGVEVQSGLLEAEARELNRGFVMRMERQRPWVRAKLAVSLDGRTAMATGESKWITGAAARADVHRLRAASSAMLTGSGTVLADDPQLNARDIIAEVKQPLRVVVDSRLRVQADAKIFSGDEAARVYYVSGSAADVARLEAAGAVVVQMPGLDGHVDLNAVMQDLAELQINDVLVEAGPALNGGLLAAGLLDELVVYQAAKIMGANASGMFTLGAIEAMSDSIELELVETRRVGSDLRLTYRNSN